MTCKSLCKQHTNFTQFWQISTTKTCDWHIRMLGSGSGKIIPIWPDPDALHCLQPLLTCPYTVWKEIKWSEILYELVRDTTCKSEKHELICAVSWTNLCSISESQLHFISFLTMCEKKIGRLCYLCILPQISPQSIFSHQILKQIFSLIFIEFKIAWIFKI